MPGSADTITIQRRPVQSESFFESSPVSDFGALASRPISSLPSSKRTSRTSRSSALLIVRSRLSAASATKSSKLASERTDAALSSPRATGSLARISAGAAAASVARVPLRGASVRGASTRAGIPSALHP